MIDDYYASKTASIDIGSVDDGRNAHSVVFQRARARDSTTSLDGEPGPYRSTAPSGWQNLLG